MKRLTILLSIVLFIIILLVLIFIPNSNKDKQIKIGAILPLTGNVGIFGDWIKNGMELALENEDTIKIIYEDSQNDPKLGLSALKKLLSIDKVNVVISAMSKVSIPLISITEEHKIPILLLDVTYPDITEKGKYVFRHFIQSDREAKILANYAVTSNIKSIGILYVNDEAGLGAKNAFYEIYSKDGEIKIIESYDTTDTDIKSQISKIIGSNVDAIFLFGNGPSWAITIRQIKELGYKGKILTNTAMYIPNFRNIAGNDAIEGVYFTYPYMDTTIKSVKSFVELYTRRYGSAPAIESAYSWDVIKLIQEANKLKGDDFYSKLISVDSLSGAFGRIELPENRDIKTKIGIGFIVNTAIVNLDVFDQSQF